MSEKLKGSISDFKVPETLFVGVGGMGSDIVARVGNRCQDGERRNIRFVAMDTDADELKCVKESKARIVPVQTSSTQTVLDYLNADESAREDWFPVNSTLYGKTVSNGSGQVRAISRLALNATIKSGNINQLYKEIDDLFLKDGGEFKQALNVVIVSSVAGGTGSGMAMVVGMLIRDYLHDHYREKAAVIRGYLLLPGVCDTFSPSESEKASLRRNGFATIKEINAFMMKASGFCGVRKDLERFDGLHIDIPTSTGGTKRLEGLPFDFCFLLDRLDKSQESMSTLEQYKEFAAQSLYEQNIGPMRDGAKSMEDNIIKEFADGDNLGRNRFGGIGASVIRYPYELVADYIAYSQAIERIGGSGDGLFSTNKNGASGWLKYDNAFDRAVSEYKKTRAYSSDEAPKISEKYVEAVNNGEERFDIDVKSYLSRGISSATELQSGVEMKINSFLEAFKEEIIRAFMSRPSLADNADCYDNLHEFNWVVYKGNGGSTVSGDKAALDDLRFEIESYAKSIAKDRARSILFNAPSMRADIKDYQLEKLFRTSMGEAVHPNAMRYLLYVLVNRLDSKEKDPERDSIVLYSEGIQDRVDELWEYGSEYAPKNGSDSKFNIPGKFSKTQEVTLNDLCNTVDSAINNYKDGQENNSDFTMLMAAAKKHLGAYYNTMMSYRDHLLFSVAYEELKKYIEGLCKEFERFYRGFEEKAYSLKKKKNEIVDALKFKRGDSVVNICGKEEHLNTLYQICSKGGTELLLPEKLNAEIFDAVKKNAEIDRVKAFDPRNSGEKEDIFDEVLIGYFKRSVREDYDEIINMNIIRAIQMQQRIENEGDRKSEDAEEEYLDSFIQRGRNLAAPGIGFGSFDQDRIVPLCAYNESLDKMLDVNVREMLQKRALRDCSSEFVSEYELRFFNALYNITPDKLSRFKNPQDCKNSLAPDEQGVYYTAYHEYSKKIGPDSTKSGTISAHVDKRWDAIVELPEISMNAQYVEMLRIHACLVYGIVQGMIIRYPSSMSYDLDKRIFAMEDEEGNVLPLIVSNGTECDEFYEILDALYRDNASVEKIYEMAKERRKYDENANCLYMDSSFTTDANSFRIGGWHDQKTSLFEIPLAYYNSLPRAKLDDNELATMVDAVIYVLEQEINRFEKGSDQGPLLAKRLEEQFRLFVDNFSNDELNKEYNLRKNSTLADNSVARVVLSKVSRKIKELGVYDFSNRVAALRNLVKEKSDKK